MMPEETKTIVVKRIKKMAAGHHGGAWKIAYADFVTAMMAFFLLMWLLGSTTQGDLEGIAQYFKTPLRVTLAGGSGAGASGSVLNGGGKDLTKKSGQVKNSEDNNPIKKISLKTAKADLSSQELDALKQLKAKILQAIDANPNLSKYRSQLLIDLTTDGLRIQVVDDMKRPMFALSRAELQPYVKDILREIGHMLNGVPNKISLSGHTDSHAFAKGEKAYSNWELSADRANASRRELVAGGMDETKLIQVVGLSSAILFDKNDPMNPINRRISIIVMNKKAEENITKDSASLDVSSSAGAENAINIVKHK
jgi:chemotaxis protein MotB